MHFWDTVFFPRESLAIYVSFLDPAQRLKIAKDIMHQQVLVAKKIAANIRL